MRIAVIGATGRIGALTREALERGGHEVVPISRSAGVDVLTTPLEPVLDGVDGVIDVTNPPYDADPVEFFTTTTTRLLDAERAVGVAHHVLLSIVGVHRVDGNAHYAGKRAQEAAVEAGGVPFSIVPATQFHDFAEMVAGWTEHDGETRVAPLLIQPIAPADVADLLARVAVGAPVGRHRDVAGPELHDLVDMTRRTLARQGRDLRIVPTWQNGVFSVEMAGEVLLPSEDAELAPTTFEAWLEGVSPAPVGGRP